MEIRVLRYFLKVAQEESITRAAELLHITQPTLSHDMRVLIQAGVVNDRRDGKNIFYSLNTERLREFEGVLHTILSAKSDCICHAQDCCE